MAATRVYILAKELGVKSTAIVKKCQDEGLDVKNHMSAISAGLAATVREWFSEGENVTTVEMADKVDLKKVRLKKRPKRKRPAKKAKAKRTKADKARARKAKEPRSAPETAVAVKEKPAPKKVAAKKPKKVKKPRPEPVLPAGPVMEEPRPAKLTGPKVIRVESPEPEPKVRRPTYRPRPKPRHDMPVTEPLMQVREEKEQLISAPTKEKKHPPKRHKDRTHGRRQDVLAAETAKRPRFASQQRQRDLEERRARLDAAGGEGLRLRPIRKIASRSLRSAVMPARPTENNHSK